VRRGGKNDHWHRGRSGKVLGRQTDDGRAAPERGKARHRRTALGKTRQSKAEQGRARRSTEGELTCRVILICISVCGFRGNYVLAWRRRKEESNKYRVARTRVKRARRQKEDESLSSAERETMIFGF
jgi:hypothetical protein